MSTRSTITIQHTDDSCESIYCHWDGYLQWNGQLLYAFYNTAEKVQELISHGDMSALGMNIGEKIDGRAFDSRRVTNFQCEFYARDRGEDKSILKCSSVNKIEPQDYNYVFSEKEGAWYVYDGSMENKQLLKDALAEEYRKKSGYGKDYLFDADTSFRVPITDDEVCIKDIATPEQLARLDALREEITGEPKRSLTLTYFDCEKDLSQYTDSLLFTDDEVPVEAEFEDSNGNNINLRLIVTGAVNLTYKEETYTNPADFPDELKEIIKSGEVYDNEDTYISDNNWFELVFTVTNAAGEEIAYDGDADIFDDLSKMTADDLKTQLTDYAENLYLNYEEELVGSFNPAKKQENKIERE